MTFIVNDALLNQARKALAVHKDIYWVLGAAGAGKSTVCQAIGQMTGIRVCDMDALIYGDYQPRYTDDRHPANRAWFGADNPLAWALARPAEEFIALLAAADAEYLDLFAEDLAHLSLDSGLLVDGGLAHPAILARVMPAERIACIEISEAMSEAVWESAERSEMKEMIDQLPGAPEPWRNFLDANALIARAMSSEARACGIRLFPRDEAMTVASLACAVADAFGMSRAG
jgi:hypothetical protein